MLKLVNDVGVKRSKKCNKQYTEQDKINNNEMINIFTSDSVDSVIFCLLPLCHFSTL